MVWAYTRIKPIAHLCVFVHLFTCYCSTFTVLYDFHIGTTYIHVSIHTQTISTPYAHTNTQTHARAHTLTINAHRFYFDYPSQFPRCLYCTEPFGTTLCSWKIISSGQLCYCLHARANVQMHACV